jgi:RHS repeat-associated protein
MNRSKREPGTSRRIGLRARGRRHHSYLGIEPLEPRQLLATVQWISKTSGAWDVGSNWNTGQVPGSGDDVGINVNGATPTITIGSGDQSVHSLMASDPLSITGGSLTVAAKSTASAGLTMTGGSLTATGSGVSLTVTGTTNVSAASLYAQGGATLKLPDLTSYAPDTSNNDVFQADGTGSVLDASALTKLPQQLYFWSVEATNGGTVNLTALAAIGSPGYVSLTDTGSSHLLLSSGITTLSGVGVTLDGADAAVASPWTSLTSGSLTVIGGSVSLPCLTDVNDTSLYAKNGGSLALPGVTSYGADNNTFQADGAGSVVDVSSLASFVQQSNHSNNWSAEANNAGTLNLSGLTSLTSANDTVSVTASGGGSLNLGGLASVTATVSFGSGISISDTGGSTLVDSKLTSLIADQLAGIVVTVDGTDPHVADSWTSFTDSNLNVGGGSYTLPALTDLDGSSLYVSSGGSLALPGFKSCVANFSTYQVDGAKSVLDLSALTSVTQNGPCWMNATNGGTLNMGGLTSLDGTNGITIKDTGGSTFVDGNLTSLNGVTVTLDGTDAHIADSWTTFAGSLSLSGGSATLPKVSDANFSALELDSAATLNLPVAGAALTSSGTMTLGAGSMLNLAGNLTFTAAGMLDEQIGGSPASGLFGKAMIGGEATLAGNFKLDLVNGYTPAAGQNYAVLKYASASGSFATISGLPSGMSASQTATELDLATAASAPDLVPTSVTAPTTATAGQLITVNWQVKDQSPVAAHGSWQDTVCISPSPAITTSSILLGSVRHTGGLSAGGSYSGSLTVALPALAPSNYYVLVQVDSLYQVDPNRANTILAAGTGPLVVTVPPSLTLGTPASGSFTAAGQDQYYQVSVPAGGTLQVALSSAARSGALALYVSANLPPTVYNYDEAVDVANQPNQTVLVPQVPAPATYYILVHSVSGSAATSAFTLNATQTAGLTISAPSAPYVGGNGGNLTIPIAGTNFSRDATASLSLGGTTIKATSIYYVSASQIYATFNLKGAATGNYALSVQSGSQQVTAPTTVAVVAATTGDPVQLVLIPPALVSAGRDSVVYVTATNTSNNDVLAPLLGLTTDGATLKLPAQATFQGASLYFLAISPSGPAGILTPGESVQAEIDFQSTTTSPTIHFQLNQADDSQPMDWASQRSALQIPTIPNAAWPMVYANFVANVGSTVANYHAVLAADATYLGGLGEPTNDVLQLLSFEIEKANATYTAQTLETVTPDSLPAPGMDLTFGQSFQQSIAGRYTTGILGFGWTTNWDISASTDPSGNGVIQHDGITFYYLKKADGSYEPEAGDHSRLTIAGGAFRLLTADQTVYQFNANRTLQYVEDTHGNRITAGYNSAGQLDSLTHSNGESLTLTYNAQGHLAQLTDSNGLRESYGYDSTGQFLTTYTDRYGTTTYAYVTGQSPQQNNALAEISYASGLHFFFTYDAQGRLIDQHRDGGAGNITFAYLTPGGYTTTDADGNKSTLLFNAFGAIAEAIDPLGNVVHYHYDANLNLIDVVGPDGARSSFVYDKNGNITSETDALGRTIAFTYDAANNLTSYTDAKGNITSYAYNSNNDRLSIISAGGGAQRVSYNPLGEATQFVNARGHATVCTYGSLGLITQQTFADGSSLSYTYDARGNLTSATDAIGNVTKFVYGDATNPDLLTEVDYPDGTYLKFSYNVVGARTHSVDQTGFEVNYAYDAAGRLQKLTDGQGDLIVQYTYNAADRLIQKDLGNGTRTAYQYDAGGNVLSIVNYAPDHVTVNSSDVYTYDGLGHVLTDTSLDGAWTYAYDADGQLTGANFVSSNPALLPNQNIQYAYDAAGNRISQTVDGVTTTYAVNSVNEYTSSTTNRATTSYQYDSDGNLIAQADPGGTTKYTFNDLNQLTAIRGPGLSASYVYDPLGNRVSQTIGGVTTNFQVDPTGLGNIVAAISGTGPYDKSGGVTAHYTFGLGLVSSADARGTFAYYDFDGHGNTIGITTGAGSYISRYFYLPFGQTTTIAAGIANPFAYSGQLGVQSDGSGLIAMRARNYSPVTGQFLSNDPLGLAGGDSNLHRALGNDPVNGSDPTGLLYEPDLSTPFLDRLAPDGRVEISGEVLAFVIYGDYIIQQLEAEKKHLSAEWLHHDLEWYDYTKKACPSHDETAAHDALEKLIREQLAREGKAIRTVSVISSLGLVSYPADDPPGDGGCCPKPPPPGLPARTLSKSGPSAATPNHTPKDPNALIGPAGYGTQGFIQPRGTWSYTVDFENDGTAAALDVTVMQQLDPNLDWSTFQLGSFGFGPVKATIPAGLTQYQTTVAYQNSDGAPLNVQVAAEFSVQTGLLTVNFTSLDPLTGQAPAGVFDGFLPPDDKTGIGEGYVRYTVQPKAALATGAAINQQASVVFDINAPILTNTALNTIDAGTPTSGVAALPATEKSPSFTVSWSGSDGKGPGIASYNDYVSDNGGPFTIWQSATTQTSAIFKGQLGHSYGFYSVASDPLGFVQRVPTTAQATTKVVLPGPPLVTVTRVKPVMNSKKQVSQVVITFSGAVNAKEAGNIRTYRLATPGTGGSYTAKNAGIITLKSASYNRANNTVTLTPTKPFTLTKPVQLLVYGTGHNGLQDSHGRLIDGDHNGTPGGNAVAILSVGGAKIQALPLVEVLSSAQEPRRQRAETAAAIDALLERDGLAALKHQLRSRRD